MPIREAHGGPSPWSSPPGRIEAGRDSRRRPGGLLESSPIAGVGRTDPIDACSGEGWVLRITKAVITAAGRGGRQRPAFESVQSALLPLVDRDGQVKPVLQIIAEEAIDSGVEEICVVCAPGDEAVYRQHFDTFAANHRPNAPEGETAADPVRTLGELAQRLRFVEQDEPKGYGHAVWCARDFVAGQPCLLLLGDHLYLSRESRRCARQLIDLAEAEGCPVSAVHATREHLIHQYGTIQGRRVHDKPGVYVVDEVIEKPNPTLAELRLQVPGVRAGHYLCFFGMHILGPAVFEILSELVAADHRELGSIQLTTALNILARRERYLAVEAAGRRFNLGVKFGGLEAQIALSLAGVDRDRILTTLLETVVRVEQDAP